MDTITWNGEQVARKFTAYQSRVGRTVRGKFGGTSSYPDEYAVKDQQGFIIKRFPTLEAAQAYADERNAPAPAHAEDCPMSWDGYSTCECADDAPAAPTRAAYVHANGYECIDRTCQLASHHDTEEFPIGNGPLVAGQDYSRYVIGRA